MERIVKVFCSGPEQKQIEAAHPVIERYKGFILVAAARKAIAILSRSHLVEDITDLYSIRAAGRDLSGKIRKRGELPRQLESGKHHYLVQFIGPIKPAWMRGVTDAGAEVRSPYQNFAYVVRADPGNVEKVAALRYVRWVGRLPYWARIATALREKGSDAPGAARLPRSRVLEGVYAIEFFGSDDLSKAARRLTRLRARILARNQPASVLTVEIVASTAQRRRTIDAIARIHGVRSIRERSLKRTSNDVAAGIMGIGDVLGSGGFGLSGKGEIVGVCDTGLDTGNPVTIHADFRNRIAAIRSYPIAPEFSRYIDNPGGDDGPADLDSGHGTHVCGSLLGNGTASVGINGQPRPIRGLAPRASVVFQAVEQEMKWKEPANTAMHGRYALGGLPSDLTPLFDFAYKNGARIHSNSWGGGDAGAYDSHCEQLDRFVWKHKDFCILVSAGNDGRDVDRDGRIDPMSVSSPGTAKNCITVGACENRRPAFDSSTYGAWWRDDYPVAPLKSDPMANDPNDVAAFSSRGPTLDNRIKPDVVAPGTFILSTRSSLIAANNSGWAAFPPSRHYFYMGGTSMATPLTAGAIALIREYLRTVARIRQPSAALLKATLVAGAQLLRGHGEGVYDYDQGFGRVNIDGVLAPAKPATTYFWEFRPGLRTGEILRKSLFLKSGKVPLRVALAYSDYPGRSLVNNLNLVVRGPTGRMMAGNSGNVPDASNNVEIVHVRRPAAGTWEIQVVGSNVPHGPQEFAIVVRAAS